MASDQVERSLRLRAGEEVEVRSREEILATLDERGALDGLPFMPEMLAYCGRRFRVYKRAHKACDTIHKTGNRRLDDAVHLEGLRCDGSAHGGCEAFCLIFWKEAWLERVGPRSFWQRIRRQRPLAAGGCSESAVNAATTLGSDPADGQMLFSCQATRLFEATRPLPWWDARQYVEDVASGNASAREILGGLIFRTFSNLLNVGGYRLLLGLYERVQRVRGGRPYPHIRGRLERTPSVELGMQAGATVRVRSREEIEATLDRNNKNRGLLFDREMSIFCGETHRVAKRVEKLIDERSGKMIRVKDCLILEGVFCKSVYSDRRIGCPRAIPSYWRQQWLEPTGAAPTTSTRKLD
jgi:hypothetical protein